MVGRPSKAPERREQILDAMEVCVRDRGIEAASMRMIADRAGVSMQLLSHYFGKRDELVLAFVRRVTTRILSAVDETLAQSPKGARFENLVEFLFSEDYKALPGNDVIGREIWALAERNPSVQEIIRESYQRAIDRLAVELARRYPDAPSSRRRSVAFGLVCMMEAGEFFAGIGLTEPSMSDARAAANLLLGSLDA